MSRQWEWMFSKVGEVDLSITAESEYLAGAIQEANAGLQQFFTDIEQFQAENRVHIQIDQFSHGHLASVTCVNCGADVTRLDGQTPAAVEAAMSEACECPADDDQVDEDEVRRLHAETDDERLRTLL
jgi:hypothetical protein